MGRISEGLLIIDKPVGPTSFDIVARVRSELRVKKTGHCGTLDPAAGGVLLVVLGRATRLAEYMNHYRKKYEAVLRLGIVTDTDDAEGEITVDNEVPPVDIEELKAILAGFTGVIEQRVPAYSAVKVDGERLYKKARRGDEVETPTRKVTIYDIELLAFVTPEIAVSVECGGGTYIRSLARDIGEKLGCGAHLSKLTRTGVGPYGLDMACQPDAVGELDGGGNCFIPLNEMLPDLPGIELDFEGATEIAYGRLLGIPEGEGVEPGLVKLIYDSELIAIALADEDVIKPEKVFLEAGDLRNKNDK